MTDAQGGVLPGATVTITNPANGYTRTVVTNAEGLFVAPAAAAGHLRAEVRADRVFDDRQGPIALATVGATVTLNHVMQVGGAAGDVTVTSQSPLVETATTVRTSTVNLDAIQNLPINGRRFQDFVTLTPTVQVDPSRGQLSFAGQRGINANVSVDGADYNQPFFGGIRGGERSNNAFTVPQEAIQEFQVVAAGYSAEFGRSTGGLVNAITKSGTNQHARLGLLPEPQQRLGRAERVRPERRADAAAVRRLGRRPHPGDRLFFFGAYEQQLFKNTRRVVFDRLAGFTPVADDARRRSTTSSRSRSRSTPPTTRRRCSAAWTTS